MRCTATYGVASNGRILNPIGVSPGYRLVAPPNCRALRPARWRAGEVGPGAGESFGLRRCQLYERGSYIFLMVMRIAAREAASKRGRTPGLRTGDDGRDAAAGYGPLVSRNRHCVAREDRKHIGTGGGEAVLPDAGQ